jgi:hypothetical protein
MSCQVSHDSLGCTLMFPDDPASACSHGLGRFGIRQQPITSGQQFLFVFDLDCAACLQKPCGNIWKIMHVRAE